MKIKLWICLIVSFACSSTGSALLFETPETHTLVSLLKVFQAYDCEGPLELKRIGKAHDGGYVVPELAMHEAEAVMGYGVSNDISFEDHVAEIYQKPAYGFDCTCPPIKGEQPLCHFIPSCIISKQSIYPRNKKRKRFSKNLAPWTSFDQQIDHLGFKNKKLFIKMDIEGNEYDTLPDILCYAPQITGIVVEIHFQTLPEISKARALLQMLDRDFLLIHVHGNNFCGDAFVTTNSKGHIPQVLRTYSTSTRAKLYQ